MNKAYYPRYYTAGSKEDEEILCKSSSPLSFPLSETDLKEIKILENLFDQEENCSGLAAPQIGISKSFMVFATPSDEVYKKFRPDWTDSMPKTIWVNPSYEGIEDGGYSFDYEGCLSIPDIAAMVKRYKKIRYKAFDIEGSNIQGECEGFLARIIQHEIDHLNGILFVDIAEQDSIMSLASYRKMRQDEINQG